MNTAWERVLKQVALTSFEITEVLRILTGTLRKDTRSPDGDLNHGPLE
jgi:hypothetical protein